MPKKRRAPHGTPDQNPTAREDAWLDEGDEFVIEHHHGTGPCNRKGPVVGPDIGPDVTIKEERNQADDSWTVTYRCALCDESLSFTVSHAAILRYHQDWATFNRHVDAFKKGTKGGAAS